MGLVLKLATSLGLVHTSASAVCGG